MSTRSVASLGVVGSTGLPFRRLRVHVKGEYLGMRVYVCMQVNTYVYVHACTWNGTKAMTVAVRLMVPWVWEEDDGLGWVAVKEFIKKVTIIPIPYYLLYIPILW